MYILQYGSYGSIPVASVFTEQCEMTSEDKITATS